MFSVSIIVIIHTACHIQIIQIIDTFKRDPSSVMCSQVNDNVTIFRIRFGVTSVLNGVHKLFHIQAES